MKENAAKIDILKVLLLLIAGGAGLCTMAYEVLWFRILKYFVDNSIHSFGIILTTFLCGLAIGGFLFSRVIDARKDPFFFLGCMEMGIGILAMLSIPLISQANNLITLLNNLFGTGWSGEILIRFIVFSAVMLPPTALMGGVFPVVGKLYTAQSATVGKTVGEIYGINTIGGVLGSFAGGFVIIPLLGVQNGISAVGFINIALGLTCLAAGSGMGRRGKVIACGACIVVAGIVAVAIPRDAFVPVYTSRYPAPANKMLYLKENINGTTAVFQDAKRSVQKYLLIDGTGEVSTDYFSMRAFRFLGLLPALYSHQTRDALIVTFGSGIVAGTIAGLPGLESVECVEICPQAFAAAHYFSYENHDVINNPHIQLIVNDGRNHILTTDKRYDIISADATHPTSSDSWILYTKEFYELCKSRLNPGGVMCQWIPLHGILERDYKIILNTFHTVFPFVAVYYTGGFKAVGHTVILGSKQEMKMDFYRAEQLLQNRQIREDLEQINVFSVYDLFNGYVLDQGAVDEFAGGMPLNTDDKPRIIFSKFELEHAPYMGIAPLMQYRKNIYPQMFIVSGDTTGQIRMNVDRCFEAMSHAVEAQALEFKEYITRKTLDFDQPKEQVVKRLHESKAMFEQIISRYTTAVNINPSDMHTLYLLRRTMSEYRSLNALLQTMGSL